MISPAGMPAPKLLKGTSLVVAALLAWFAAGEPTELTLWDGVLRVGFAVALVWLGGRLDPLGWSAVGGAVCVYCLATGDGAIAFAFGAVATLVGAAGSHARVGRRLAGPIAGLALGGALLRLPDSGFFGSSALAAATIAVSLIVAVWTTDHTSRRPIRRALLGIAAAVVAAGVVGLMAVVPALGSLSAGGAAAERGAALLRQGDVNDATGAWTEAANEFLNAAKKSQSVWTRPMTLVPVVGRHVELAASGADEAASLAGLVVNELPNLDAGELRLPNGKIDFGRTGQAHASLERLNRALFDAESRLQQARDPWIAAWLDVQVGDGVEVIRDLRDAGEAAAETLRLLPKLAGESEPSRYLVVFANPAEAREMGGLFSAYALVELDQGELSLTDVGVNDRLLREVERGLPPDTTRFPPTFAAYEPWTYPVNLTGSPDLGVTLRAAQEIFPRLFADIDGLIYADPRVVQSMVGLVGGVRLTSIDTRLDRGNTAAFLFRDQYAAFELTRERDEALVSVLDRTFLDAGDRVLTDPAQAQRLLAENVRRGELQMVSVDPEVNALLQRVGLWRPFGPTGSNDFLAVLQANSGENKLDAYLTRSITYSAVLELPESQLSAVVDVALESAATPDLPPPVVGPSEVHDGDVGTNLTVLSVHTPHELRRVSVDGRDVSYQSTREFGLWRHAIQVSIGPGSSVDVSFELEGAAVFEVVDGRRMYQLDLWHQPLVANDTIEVELDVGAAASARLIDARSTFALDEDVTLRWAIDPDQ